MELYDSVAEATSRRLTHAYSTSFGVATRMMQPSLRQDVYNIYGLVRLADEVVDSYGGADALTQLDILEGEVYAAIKRRYSTNLIVHAFAITANKYKITKTLIAPFFASMRIDAPGSTYNPKDYKAYIHGSAEVVGLMCLLVFCDGDSKQYNTLKDGAIALGAAFQKANFLRDLAEDHATLGRFYFPEGSFEAFDEAAKRVILADIEHDFAVAAPAIQRLPKSARTAVAAATNLYKELVQRLSDTPAAVIRQQRIRIPNQTKLLIIAKTIAKRGRHV